MIQQIGLRIVFAIATLVAPALAVAQNVPLTRASVGDWVEFNAIAPSILPGAEPQTLTMRYTVKAKTATMATVTAKSWAGDVLISEQDIDWPLDQPLDAVKLAGVASDK